MTWEVYRAKLGDEGEPVTDANGRFLKGDLTGIFVMEKRIGWGAEHPDDRRNREWEYARFTPEGKSFPDPNTKPFFQCHMPMSGQDFVFTLPRLVAGQK